MIIRFLCVAEECHKLSKHEYWYILWPCLRGWPLALAALGLSLVCRAAAPPAATPPPGAVSSSAAALATGGPCMWDGRLHRTRWSCGPVVDGAPKGRRPCRPWLGTGAESNEALPAACHNARVGHRANGAAPDGDAAAHTRVARRRLPRHTQRARTRTPDLPRLPPHTHGAAPATHQARRWRPHGSPTTHLKEARPGWLRWIARAGAPCHGRAHTHTTSLPRLHICHTPSRSSGGGPWGAMHLTPAAWR